MPLIALRESSIVVELFTITPYTSKTCAPKVPALKSLIPSSSESKTKNSFPLPKIIGLFRENLKQI